MFIQRISKGEFKSKGSGSIAEVVPLRGDTLTAAKPDNDSGDNRTPDAFLGGDRDQPSGYLHNGHAHPRASETQENIHSQTQSAAVEVIRRISDVFASADAEGFLHVREIGGDDRPQVEVGADSQVVLASVFKVIVATAYVRAVVAGRLDEAEQAVVSARYRIGGIGTAGCRYDVRMSWRDLAEFMMTMSDNAATDVLYHRLGTEAIQQVLSDLNLKRTRMNGCCEDLFKSVAIDLGVPYEELESAWEAATPEQIRALTVRDPERTISSTPREITRLLNAIWTDQAAPAAACKNLREIMSRQIWPHRLGSGFPDEVSIAAKTGTLDGIRNEAGVLTYPDGRRYAVAVFTRTGDFANRAPRLDAAIGESARIAVDYLRQDAHE